MGENIFEIKVTVANEGALPTYIMKHAIDIGSVTPIEVEVELEDKMKFVKGKKLEKIDLEGYLNRELTKSMIEREASEDKHKKTLVWFIGARKPCKIRVKVNSQRAGRHQATLNIG
jgi:hypothetical protein